MRTGRFKFQRASFKKMNSIFLSCASLPLDDLIGAGKTLPIVDKKDLTCIKVIL